MSGFFSGAAGGLPMAFAFIASGGTISVSSSNQNINSSSKPSTGNYIIDYTDAGFTLAPQVLIQLMDDNASELRYGYVNTVSATTCAIVIYRRPDASITVPQLTDNRFRFLAIGL